MNDPILRISWNICISLIFFFFCEQAISVFGFFSRNTDQQTKTDSCRRCPETGWRQFIRPRLLNVLRNPEIGGSHVPNIETNPNCLQTALSQIWKSWFLVLYENLDSFHGITELILGLRPTNERRRYFVTTSVIGWAQTSNQPRDYISPGLEDCFTKGFTKPKLSSQNFRL